MDIGKQFEVFNNIDVVVTAEVKSKLYSDMLDNAKDIILLLNEDGKIMYANNEASKCYGYSIKELLTMNIADIRKENNLDLVKQQLNTAKLQGTEFETIHFKKDKQVFQLW
jgi:two-component system, sensor histidine kinase